jgi:signal transduction histidine kinase
MGLKKDDLKIARGGWGILKRNLDRIMNLSLNMLAYSRQRTLEVELTKVGPLLEECAELLHDLCQARQVALLVDADPEMPPIPMDPHLMHQALMNLMTNAVDAVEPKRGAVTVRASYHPASRHHGSRPEAAISIIDNGPGIPPDKHEVIFEPFFTTKGLRGTGLGLAVTRRIVEEHGGRIVIESDTGKGSVFKVILPADRSGLIDPSATAHSKQHAADAGQAL